MPLSAPPGDEQRVAPQQRLDSPVYDGRLGLEFFQEGERVAELGLHVLRDQVPHLKALLGVIEDHIKQEGGATASAPSPLAVTPCEHRIALSDLVDEVGSEIFPHGNGDAAARGLHDAACTMPDRLSLFLDLWDIDAGGPANDNIF